MVALEVADRLVNYADGSGVGYRSLRSFGGGQIRRIASTSTTGSVVIGGGGGIAAPLASQSHPADVGGLTRPADAPPFGHVLFGRGKDLNLLPKKAYGRREMGGIDGGSGGGEGHDPLVRGGGGGGM